MVSNLLIMLTPRGQSLKLSIDACRSSFIRIYLRFSTYLQFASVDHFHIPFKLDRSCAHKDNPLYLINFARLDWTVVASNDIIYGWKAEA
jgi:hypothetical protein